jgi:hypothetical protein
MNTTRRNSLYLQGGGRMKPYRGTLLASAMLLASLPLFGCGNALDEGSSPSGSYITATASESSIEADVYRKVCSQTTDETTGVTTYTYETGSDGPVNHSIQVTLSNDSTPNTPSGSSTNSLVTMSRYRVDFTGTSQKVSLQPIEGAQTVTVPKDGTDVSMAVLVMDHETLEAIRSKYGYANSLTLIAKVTIWGEDAFHVTVSTQVSVTIIVADYGSC